MLLRDEIHSRLQTDLVGPFSDDEVLDDYPSDVYLTGILFPQRAEIAPEQDEILGAEGSSASGSSEDTSRDEVGTGKRQRPSSMGVSFAIEGSAGSPAVRLQFNAARYVSESAGSTDGSAGQDGDDSHREGLRLAWRRVPLSLTIDELQLQEGPQNFLEEHHGVPDIRVYVTCSKWGDFLLTTVSVLNAAEYEKGSGRPELEELCLFQTEMRVTCACEATRFKPRPLGWSAADEDSSAARLIYRDAHEFAVGHTCSADWTDSNGEAASVISRWLPLAVVPAISSEGDRRFAVADGQPDFYSTAWLAQSSGAELSAGLSRLPEAYTLWLEAEARKLDGMHDALQNQAKLHLDRAGVVGNRIRGGIAAIAGDAEVEAAFRLANRAIQLQAQWGRPDAGSLRWRPFQLGFILLALASVADRSHPDRDVADLLWFPTGGGKTEAYLALIAFVVFIRRMRYGDDGAGVASIMRYTLRLLTVQQFQRAAALICACELLRLKEHLPDGIFVELGETPFSIGLWVGQDSVPNSVAQAAAALRQGLPSTPKQLTKCPVHRESTLIWELHDQPDRIVARCSKTTCQWGGTGSHLPVWTVDEDIYRVRPSLVIGTIDKFAQIVRKPETVALFGTDGESRPPDLIIQDELHLISGPLGTVAGVYECAIDALSTRNECRPKIVASTATIREAKSQIKAVFDRGTCLFPPPIIDASSSGFAVVDTNAPGRLYAGLTTAGRSAKYALQAVAASLIQSATVLNRRGDGGSDWYTTLVAYFNSLRELGGALVLMQDDVDRTLKQLCKYRDESPRDYMEVTELTSRVTASEIRGILDRLEISCGEDGSIDVLLASNMISVGVDISRLGMMVVNGQPKTMAEYIQATSRVGRGQVPGLVLTLFNDAKARDRSRFEAFRTWHETLYRDVEATSVTPFSSRARDKALHAALVGMVRHLFSAMRKNPNLHANNRVEVEKFADLVTERAQRVDPDEALLVDQELTEIINRWEWRTGLKSYWNNRQVNTSLLISAEDAAKRRALGRAAGQAWPTPNSMRTVEPSTTFILKETL